MLSNPSTDYSIKELESSQYSYRRISANEGSSVTVQPTASNRIVFEIAPNTVANLSHSWLQYTGTWAGTTGGVFNHVYSNILPVQSIVLRDDSNKKLLDLSSAHKFFNTICHDSISEEELEQCDLGQNGANDFNLIRKCNGIATNAAATPVFRPTGNSATVNLVYREPAYLLPGADNSGPVLYYKIPFSLIKKTILAQDQNICYNKTLYLELTFLPSQNYTFYSGSLTDVHTATGTYAQSILLENMALYLAVEKNEKIAQAVRSQMMGEGLKFLTDFPHTFTQSLSSQSQNVSVRLNNAHGIKVKEIYAAPYSATETGKTAFDHDNISNAKVVSFDEYVDDRKRNEDLIVCTAGTNLDYVLMKKHLKAKMMPALRNIYAYNWFWKYDPSAVEDKNVLQGDSLVEKELKYSLQLTTANVTNNWHIFAICQKPVVIRANDIQV
jgi:hypothetical protein